MPRVEKTNQKYAMLQVSSFEYFSVSWAPLQKEESGFGNDVEAEVAFLMDKSCRLQVLLPNPVEPRRLLFGILSPSENHLLNAIAL